MDGSFVIDIRLLHRGGARPDVEPAVLFGAAVDRQMSGWS